MIRLELLLSFTLGCRRRLPRRRSVMKLGFVTTVKALAFCVAAATVGCAGQIEEEEENAATSSAALVTTTTVNVGDGTSTYNRFLKKDAATDYAALFMTSTALSPVPAYTYSSTKSYCSVFPWVPNCASQPSFTFVDDDYKGCGRKAAQNALYYFGIKMSQSDIGEDVSGWHIPGTGRIATYPDQLRDGLQEILDRKAKTNFIVRRKSHADKADIRAALATGYPVIALVNNGSHWVVIGAKGANGSWWVIDDFSATWRADSSVSLDFSGVPAWYALADLVSSYEEGTIITFAKAPPPAPGSPGGGSNIIIRQR
jgi:hypothetical protein